MTVTDPQLDHYIIYHCHFELGKLYAARGDFAKAGKNFDIVMSGKLSPFGHKTSADASRQDRRGQIVPESTGQILVRGSSATQDTRSAAKTAGEGKGHPVSGRVEDIHTCIYIGLDGI